MSEPRLLVTVPGTESIDLDLSVRIPLVGGKIEAMVAGMFSDALDVEHRVGTEWLAR